MAVLIGMSGEVKGARFEINKDRLVLGRNAGCDIVLQDNSVSSQHCYVGRRGSGYVIHDLNSTNGTRVNAQVVSEAELLPKQVIQIGATEFLFDADPSEIPLPGQAASTQVVVESDQTSSFPPKSFSSVSPFGSRRRENYKLWPIFFGIIGLVVLAGLAYLIFKLYSWM